MNLHRKLFFLLIVFLPTQLGFHFWPDWASILGRKIDYLSPTIYVTDLLVLTILLLWIIESRRHKQIIIYVRSIKAGSKIVLLCTGIYILVNIMLAQNMNVALIAWIKLLEYVALCFYITHQRITLMDIINPLVVGVVGISLLGISQYMAQRSLGGLFWFVGERSFMVDTPAIARITLCNIFNSSCELRLRSYATFSHPNVFGGYLAVMLPLILFETIKNLRSGVKFYVYGIVFVVGAIALVLSFSRSAWIVATFGIVCMLFFRNKHLKLRLPIILVLCSVVLVGFLVAPIQDESVVVRQQLNQAALVVWRESPYVGIGLNNFLFGLSPTLRSNQVYILQPVHNIYLLSLSQLGLGGLSFVLGYVIIFMRSIRREYRNNFSPIYISLFSLMLLGLVDHYLFTLQQGQLLVSLIISMAAVAIRFPPNT